MPTDDSSTHAGILMQRLNSKTFFASVGLTFLVGIGLLTWYLRSTASPPQVIAVVLPSSTNPFWIDVRRGIEKAKSEIIFPIQIQASPDQDATGQVDLLKGFLDKKVSALVLGPASDFETVPIVAEYGKARIPVVVIDTELNEKEVSKYGAQVSAFIGSNNLDGGRKAARAMADALKDSTSKRVLVIEGSRVHQSAIDRADGFLEIGKSESLETISLSGEWSRDRAQELVSAQLSRNLKIDGIFASNDDMAMGAIAALKNRNIPRTQWPIVIGFDATRDGLTAMTNQDMYTTVAQNAIGLGESGAKAANNLLAGIPVVRRVIVNVDIVAPTFRR